LSCATSGDYQRYFEKEGKRYHHILDLSTGYPADLCAAVTVIAPDGYRSDLFSTIIFILGPDKGLDFLESHPELKAVYFDKKGARGKGNLKLRGK
jgi:thiamine biosynthesis lipoprotein